MVQRSTVWSAGLFGLIVAAGVAAAQTSSPYHVINRLKVGGEGGWDYVLADGPAHRLYLTHSSRVEVLDTESGKPLGAITGLVRTHGVLIAPDGKTGFISDGGANAVIVFDPATFKTIGKIAAGKNPDGMAIEPLTGTLWAFNGGSNNVTVIDMAGRKVVGTIALPGRPEFPQADGQGNVYDNIEDKNSLVRLDAKAMKLTATWPLAGCESPSGLAVDRAGMRLFSVCDGKKMAVTDARTGKQLARPSIGEGPDAADFDAKSGLALSSNGEGTLSVVDASKPDFPVQTVVTAKGARTLAFDPTTNRIYLPTADLGAPAAGAKYPSIVPGTFTVLVVGRE